MSPIDHVAFLVPDLDAAMAEIGALFGVTWAAPKHSSVDVRLGDGRVVRRESTSVWSESKPAIQLQLAPEGTEISGPVLDHVGRRVEDFQGTVAGYAEAGCTLTMTAAADDGKPSHFAFFESPYGVRLEVVQA